MAIFTEVVNLWKSNDLLSQAWDESYNMIRLSNKIFGKAVFFLRNGGKKSEIKALKKRDQEINNFQKNVRKKVITHFAVSKDMNHLPNGLVLLNIVVDIERVGDYTKNILDLAMNHPKKIIAEDISSDLYDIEQEILERFKKTIHALDNQDQESANLSASYTSGGMTIAIAHVSMDNVGGSTAARDDIDGFEIDVSFAF